VNQSPFAEPHPSSLLWSADWSRLKFRFDVAAYCGIVLRDQTSGGRTSCCVAALQMYVRRTPTAALSEVIISLRARQTASLPFATTFQLISMLYWLSAHKTTL
jgi:hypothetical protein